MVNRFFEMDMFASDLIDIMSSNLILSLLCMASSNPDNDVK